MLDWLEVKLAIKGSSHDVKIEEILTKIRVLEGVATVSQDGMIRRTPDKKRVATIIITFDSGELDKAEFVKKLIREMKKEIVAVERILLLKLNDKDIVGKDGKKIVI